MGLMSMFKKKPDNEMSKDQKKKIYSETQKLIDKKREELTSKRLGSEKRSAPGESPIETLMRVGLSGLGTDITEAKEAAAEDIMKKHGLKKKEFNAIIEEGDKNNW